MEQINERRTHETMQSISQGFQINGLPAQLEDELFYYQQRGVRLSLNGKPSSPKGIIKAFRSNWGNYMREYLEDEAGRIAMLNFRLVRQR
jgi:hypothetical protein